MKKSPCITIKLCLIFLLSFYSKIAQTQVFDDFSDSIFSSQVWQGDWPYFKYVENGLQSNCATVNTNFGLRTKAQFDKDTASEWRLKVDLKFETSSLNYVDLILINNFETKQKYFIRIGNSKDEVALYYQDSTDDPLLLKDGIDKFTANTNLEIKGIFKDNRLTIFYKSDELDSFYQFEAGLVATSSVAEMGFDIQQSTSSFFGKHFIREFYFGPVIEDTIPPNVIGFELINKNNLKLKFDQAVQQKKLKFSAFNAEVLPKKSNWILPDEVELTFAEDFYGVDLKLHISECCDLENNCANDTTIYFSNIKPLPANQYDVLITEIFPDSDPSVGLPNHEFVELYNSTSEPINLLNWAFGDPGKAVQFEEHILLPYSYTILCDEKNSKAFEPFGKVIGLPSFPTLNNAGDSLWLKDPDNQVVHSVVYSDNLYGSSWKRGGGWSLEMIDIEQPCIENNWLASENPKGGTPGSINSINTKLIDQSPPRIIYAYPLNELEILLQLSEKIGTSAMDVAQFFIDNQPVNVEVVSDNSLKLILPFQLKKQEIYNVQIGNIMDCVGNFMHDTILKVGMPQPINVGDVLINEILFNPVSGTEDFVEVVNNSDKVFNLAEIKIGKKDSGGFWEELFLISETNRLFFPSEILAFSTDIKSIIHSYPKAHISQLIEIPQMPSLPDDKGNVGLALIHGVELDWISYDKNQHASLTGRTEGASLERLSLEQPSLALNNWTTASYLENYATPGYLNSMRLKPFFSEGKFTLSSDPFSPNGDGYNDILQMSVQVESSSALYQIQVFDIGGNQVAYPYNSARGSGNEIFTWNGLSDAGQILLPGIYIIVCEVFTVEFGKIVIKKPVTLIW